MCTGLKVQACDPGDKYFVMHDTVQLVKTQSCLPLRACVHDINS